ncbi:MAG: type II toxin-antitoxin system VapC family toxin [Candidatus Sulfotelmatobacter sp.]|jgi:PIN domain nuclease of toxin-antitoxin system
MAKMKLLLDTHIWLWSIGEPHRLSRRVAKELDSPENQLWLSAVSIWEALLLCRKGRITLSKDFPSWLVDALKAIPLNDAPLTFEVGKALSTVQLSHADPADLFLAATAKAFGLTLVTSDRNLIRAEGISVIAN